MRHLRFLTIGFVVIALSCSREEPAGTGDSGMGEVTISLSSVEGSVEMKPMTKSEEEIVPDVDDFEVEIYNSRGIRLFRDTYANSAGKKIALNSGEYRLLAQHGDSAGVGFGADKAWFSADRTFTVHPQTVEAVEAVARMNKVKVAVNHGPNIQSTYPDGYYSIVRNESGRELKFTENESRAGYVPAGELVYELYVYNSASQKWFYYSKPAVEYAPNTFVSFNVDFNSGEGALKVSVTIDDSVDQVTEEYTIPFEAAPQERPSVTLAGFSGTGSFSFIEGVEYHDVQADIVAKGRIKDCVLTHDSDYMSSQGVPSSVNLADPDLDAGVVSALKSLGFKWPRKMRGERFGNVDFSAVPDGKTYSRENAFDGSFSLSVTDSADFTATVDFTMAQVPASLELNAGENNFWARRIRGLSASTPDGNQDYVAIQYSGDGSSWTTVEPSAVSAGPASFPDITGLEPDTQYYLRAIYNGNEDNVSEPVSFTTETEQQVGNAGFEEWTDEKFKVGSIWPANWEMTWYKPSGAWAVNSKKTMPGYYSNAFLDKNTTNFPCVAYVVDDEGNKSALLYTVRIQTTENKLTVPGELFIGSANDSGDHKSDGCPFDSRPAAVKFSYKFSPVNSESFYMKADVKSVDGTLLASVEKTDGAAAESWKDAIVDLTYADITTKAASIYITFKASSSGSPSYKEGVSMTIGQNNTYSGCNIGSILTIDDIKLIYE